MYTYLFGAPALPRKPSRTEQSDWFVLGAYPSALHVKWVSPDGTEISAVAVADEPEPFWRGEDQDHRIKDWAENLPWNPRWGRFSSPGELNGSSGRLLFKKVLTPLSIDPFKTWITDCLDIYHESDDAAKRLSHPSVQAMLKRLDIPDRNLPTHPSEDRITHAAQVDRLRKELGGCRPRHVITLGNAALRTIAKMIEGTSPIRELVADASYGQTFEVQIMGLPPFEWLPLAHPAAHPPFPQDHLTWLESTRRAA